MTDPLELELARKRGELLKLTRLVFRQDQAAFGAPWGLSRATMSRYEGEAPEWIEDALYGRLARAGLAVAYWHQLRVDAGLGREADPRGRSHVHTGRTPRRRS